ncbi:ZIP family metal transporter [Hirschia baltica]|uniref:Zinc/iron permease n=1 Tax=Hirschia baltica (strain ATCC 49814 / DSM 5838 / IFAM 1418) TaxID=582402 RepID=C6XJD0_HIRBI|nr:hypothetical protein [Hirschia baltica]ACT59225.1 hypothetical protein Hbal_1537 [Hirschia baltica ATCC 49814]
MHILENKFDIPIALSFSILAGIICFLGIMLAAFNRTIAERFSHIGAILAGFLLGLIAITHLLPESLSFGILASLFICLGFLLGLYLDKVGHVDTQHIGHVTLTPIIAIALHSFLDGMIYVVSFGHSHEGGIFAGIGLVLHELPEGLITFILCFSLLKRLIPALTLAIFAAALSTPMGTIIGNILGHHWGEAFLAYAYPISAGLVSWASISLLKEHAVKILPNRNR